MLTDLSVNFPPNILNFLANGKSGMMVVVEGQVVQALLRLTSRAQPELQFGI
jgi:hypothetical protein